MDDGDGVRAGGGGVGGSWEVEEVIDREVEGEEVLMGDAGEWRERGQDKEMQ